MSRKITDQALSARGTAYGCFAAASSEQAVQDLVYGEEQQYKCHKLQALWYKWAAMIMNTTRRETPCAGQCVDHDFACQVINLFDAGCVECGCGEQWPTCTLTADYTVESAVDASFQPQADPLKFYLIVTDLTSWGGTWGQNVNDIVTGTTFSLAPNGSLIYAASQDKWWTMIGGAPHEYFPVVQGTLSGTTLTVVSQDPTTNATLGRDVLIQTSSDGVTWGTTIATGAYLGPESVLGSSFDMTVPNDTAFIRITYYIDNEVEMCQYGPFLGNVPAQLARSIHFDVGAYLDDQAAAPYPFNFLDNLWTIAFWIRSDVPQVWPFITNSHNPLYAVRNFDSQWEIDFEYTQDAPNYPDPPFSNGFSVRMDDIIGGGSFDVINSFDYLTANPYDGQWNHVMIVRDSLNADVPLKAYVNGIDVGMTIYQPTSGARISDNTPATDFHPGDQSGGGIGFKTVDFYVCSTPRTQTDAQNVFMTRTIAGNDMTWGRISWNQPAAADAIGVPPYISGNQAGAPDLTPHAGGVAFDPDVP